MNKKTASLILLVTLLLCTVVLSGCGKKSVFEEVASWESEEIQLVTEEFVQSVVVELVTTGTVTAEGKTHSVVLLSYYLRPENRWLYCIYDLEKLEEKTMYELASLNRFEDEEKAKAAMWVFEASKKGDTLTLTVVHDYTYARGESETDHKGKVYTLKRAE